MCVEGGTLSFVMDLIVTLWSTEKIRNNCNGRDYLTNRTNTDETKSLFIENRVEPNNGPG